MQAKPLREHGYERMPIVRADRYSTDPNDYVLKLRSDQTDSVSVDLHQQRVNGDGRLLSFGLTCGRLRSQKKRKQPFMHPETPAEVGQGVVQQSSPIPDLRPALLGRLA
jgi:hypothetical protein